MIETLGIRWIELAAQTVNFAIVLFVLWKLAYKPIFNMLEARREKIAEGVANAEKIKAELAKTEAARQKILADAGDEQILIKAREAAAQERATTLAQVKKEVGRLVVQTSMTVTGKILSPVDQNRLAEETQKQIV
jgi:F-type H+-transporting ATPase subunit b